MPTFQRWDTGDKKWVTFTDRRIEGESITISQWFREIGLKVRRVKCQPSK